MKKLPEKWQLVLDRLKESHRKLKAIDFRDLGLQDNYTQKILHKLRVEWGYPIVPEDVPGKSYKVYWYNKSDKSLVLRVEAKDKITNKIKANINIEGHEFIDPFDKAKFIAPTSSGKTLFVEPDFRHQVNFPCEKPGCGSYHRIGKKCNMCGKVDERIYETNII